MSMLIYLNTVWIFCQQFIAFVILTMASNPATEYPSELIFLYLSSSLREILSTYCDCDLAIVFLSLCCLACYLYCYVWNCMLWYLPVMGHNFSFNLVLCRPLACFFFHPCAFFWHILLWQMFPFVFLCACILEPFIPVTNSHNSMCKTWKKKNISSTKHMQC